MPPSLAELTQRFLSQAVETRETVFEPYDVASAFRVEPRTAWSETLLVTKLLGQTVLPNMPAEWADTVSNRAPVRLLPMAVGHYPQMVSDLSLVLDGVDAPTPLDSLPCGTSSGLINDTAMIQWNLGNYRAARASWNTLPDTALKSFNLGVAALAVNDSSEAARQLKAAVAGLPESSGWTALAELYLSLAQS